MKKLLKLCMVLVLLLVVGVIAAAALVDVNSFKPQILAQAEKTLGRKVTMDGNISLRIFPTIAVKIEKIAIGNPEWAGGGNMLSAKSISLGAELMPLLDKQLKVNSLEIDEPVALLVKKGALANWQFESAAPKTDAPKAGASASGDKFSLGVKHFYIANGDITFKDLASGSKQHASALNLKLAAPEIESLVQAEGSATLNGETLKIKTGIGTPLEMLAGKKSSLDANVSFGKLGAVYKGSIVLGDVPSLAGTLSSDSINLNDFIKEDAGADGGAATEAKASGRLSDEKIDLSALGAANLLLDVNLSSFTFKKLTIAPLKTKVILTGGALNFQIPEFAAYGGKMNIGLRATSGGSVSVTGSASDVQAEPFLADWANNDNITGKLNTVFDLKAAGSSQRALVNSLGGFTKFTFRDGAIKGKNLAANIRRLKALGGSVEDAPKQTDFSEITGSVNIANGIAKNNDLFMKSPLIRLRGEGEVNIPTWQIAYKLKPEIVGTLKGQGGKDDAAGVTVPLKISGNLSNPEYAIDAKAALMDNLTPDKIEATKENVKALKEQFKSGGGIKGLKGLLGN